jgi:hypothetical protein
VGLCGGVAEVRLAADSGGYGEQPMSRICARPSCRDQAEATLSYSYADRTVWIEPITREDDPMTHDLCADHAERLVLPRGWTRRDIRAVADVGGPITPSVRASIAPDDRAISA